ncbi:lanthionine synthetase LanC family protein [Pedobacter sp. WC2423]|uniref:lanthionine synthetase LanC family protein n=1 Tax=Pedobacter sp. WC2423 TaxID=3234142 RepID=UPI0034676AC8
MPEELQTRIYEIKTALDKNQHLFLSAGLNDGILGLSLFYLYFYEFSKDERALNQISLYIDQAINYITNSQCEPHELIEFSDYLCFLNEKGFIDNKEALKYLKQLNPLIKTLFKTSIKEKDLDSLSGCIAIGHYYLRILHLIDYSDQLIQLINLIEQEAVLSDSGMFWYFKNAETKKTNIELGIYHGVTGVIYFLASAYAKKIAQKTCLSMIHDAIFYLSGQKQKKDNTLFDIDALIHKRIAYQNLAYGDIGIGYVLFKTGKIIGCKQYIEEGIEILEHAALFMDDKKEYIRDAELIYGSSGLLTIFSFFYSYNNSSLFLKAKIYWLSKTLDYNNNNTKWAGYETFINGYDDHIQLSFCHGLCGIGIALMACQQEDFSYLRFLSY